jgi:hypothetical protein
MSNNSNPSLRFNVRIDTRRIHGNMQQRLKLAQIALDTQIIKDSNFYAPEDTQTLQRSAITATDVGSGKVVWNTPYARKLYFNPEYNFSKDKNPNAQGLWFEAAKAVKKGVWKEVAQRALNGGGQ